MPPSTPHAASDTWFPVSSSAISAVCRRGSDLGVRWKQSGRVYWYRGAAHLLDDVLSAPSVGIYVNTVIKAQFAVR